ncbi:MAG: glutathione S-transferase family protein [Alphaproteobacteria bacterium]|nr:glutathione S-transferase family protein [Alphaproteobacteria bacterium]
MTLKLFYSPGSCSLAPHIALEETGAAYERVKVALASGEQKTPAYLAINPKGRVPVLAEDDHVVTENPAILRAIARRFPAARLWPDDDIWAEAACLEWCAWLSNTIHVHYAHVRRSERYADDETAKAEVQRKGKEVCRQLWADVDARLKGRTWAIGERYSVADPYLLVFWTWGRGPVLGFDMAKDYPNWTAHARRMAQRPAVQRVFAREELALPG